jgi:hypothetical protein
MNTTISLPTAEYNRAKTFAKEQNLSLDELFAVLIGQLTLKDEDAIWYNTDESITPYSLDELQARIDEGEAQFERGECKTHEQLMAELKEEFSWLK